MPRRDITPVQTRRGGDAPIREELERPPLEEQVEALLDVQETMLTTPANAPERQAALDRLRQLRERLGSRSAEQRPE